MADEPVPEFVPEFMPAPEPAPELQAVQWEDKEIQSYVVPKLDDWRYPPKPETLTLQTIITRVPKVTPT
jgi:hypothetical protein